MAGYVQGVPIKITDTFSVSGVATDPSTVVYTILGPDGTATIYTWPGDIEITHLATGQFSLSLSPPALPGVYSYDVDATGTVVASRSGSFTVLPNAAVESDVEWAVQGPCAPWVSSNDVWNCCGQPTETVNGIECAVDFTAEALAATQALWELSGRLYSGLCEQTVRPCGQMVCGFQMLSRGYIVGPWDYGPSFSIGWTGGYWGYDNYHACGCNPLDVVLLPGYPVRDIVEVKIDGAVVDPDTYRLDNRRKLVRMRDPADPSTQLFWPSCQLLDLNDDQPGTFSVTYRYGMDPPMLGQEAAMELACELHKACSNSIECNLPGGATRIVRQGVTIERSVFTRWGQIQGVWRTGLTRVDAFLNSFNRTGMTRRPVTWSPDALKYAKKVGQ